MSIQRIAIIGFGEAGGIFGTDAEARGLDVTMFDILLRSDRSRQAMLQKATLANVRAVDAAPDLAGSADLVISAVTASSALDAARSIAPALRGQMVLDVNSISPETKQ